MASRPYRVKHWEPTDTKACTRCGEVKLITEFHSHSQKPHLFMSHCKACGTLIKRERWNRIGPERRYASQFKRRLKRYGMTPQSYEEMLIAQGRRCAICRTTDPGSTPNHKGEARFAVDHDHKTGTVRGLLCGFCNTGLGHFRDDVALMARAITYIEESKEVPQ